MGATHIQPPGDALTGPSELRQGELCRHSHSATGDAFTGESEFGELHRYEPGDAFTSHSEQRRGRV